MEKNLLTFRRKSQAQKWTAKWSRFWRWVSFISPLSWATTFQDEWWTSNLFPYITNPVYRLLLFILIGIWVLQFDCFNLPSFPAVFSSVPSLLSSEYFSFFSINSMQGRLNSKIFTHSALSIDRKFAIQPVKDTNQVWSKIQLKHFFLSKPSIHLQKKNCYHSLRTDLMIGQLSFASGWMLYSEIARFSSFFLCEGLFIS